jgi:hypothetical protein
MRSSLSPFCSLPVYWNERFTHHHCLSSHGVILLTTNFQTANVGGTYCSCYHDETFHPLPLLPNVAQNQNSGHSQIPVPPGHILPVPSRLTLPLPPFAGPTPTPPTFANSHLSPPLGTPSNQATAIFRPFRPYQGHPASTSEDNRKKSMTRRNGTKPRRKPQAARPNDEPLASDPIDPEISVLLFPLNV